MARIITFNVDTNEFTEYTECEWGEEVEYWREKLWAKYEDGIFDFDQYEIMRPKVVKSASRLFGELYESVPYTKINFNLIQQTNKTQSYEQNYINFPLCFFRY